MKAKTSLTRIICGTMALGVLAAAYGTCYLDRVVVCFATGEPLPSFTYNCGTATATYTEQTQPVPTDTSVTSYYPYANQNAWMHSVYSVTAGGFGTFARVYPCDALAADIYGGNDPDDFLGAGNNFEAVVYDACQGVTYTSNPGSVTAWNGNTLIPYISYTQNLFGGGQGERATLSCATN